ncbi:hypothetical protein K439DRAFT_1633976 [Ramaria rubella]|nr:hypothetical protein K439DRAFT_1633974 [Ramaria rubella]KAF8583896.1 hypothetical protein K439DRAFT_1633976 [Ramaria rubella]
MRNVTTVHIPLLWDLHSHGNLRVYCGISIIAIRSSLIFTTPLPEFWCLSNEDLLMNKYRRYEASLLLPKGSNGIL